MIQEALLIRYPGSDPARYQLSEWVCFHFRNARCKTIDGYVNMLRSEGWSAQETPDIAGAVENGQNARFFRLTRKFPDGECLIAIREIAKT